MLHSGSKNVDSPESAIFKIPSLLTNRLEVFTSRCKIPTAMAVIEPFNQLVHVTFYLRFRKFDTFLFLNSLEIILHAIKNKVPTAGHYRGDYTFQLDNIQVITKPSQYDDLSCHKLETTAIKIVRTNLFSRQQSY